MARKTFYILVGIIFTLVALFNAERLYMDWAVIIANWSVPKSVGWASLIVAVVLALFAFRFAANDDDD
jgi:hypothetical protein